MVHVRQPSLAMTSGDVAVERQVENIQPASWTTYSPGITECGRVYKTLSSAYNAIEAQSMLVC